MVEVTFLIPGYSNARVQFPKEEHDFLRTRLGLRKKLGGFGGYSDFPSLVKGSWTAPDGTTSRDELILFVVFVSDLISESANILETAKFANGHYGQEAIAIRYMEMSEIL